MKRLNSQSLRQTFVVVVVVVPLGRSPAYCGVWTHTLRPFYNRPIALTREGRSQVDDVCECWVTEG